MNEHRYILEPYKGMNTRYRCPSCQHRDKTFSLYIDTEKGEHIHPTVGRCNRESNCGHHYTPKQYFQDNNISFDTPQPNEYKPRLFTPLPKPASFIPVEKFKASLKAHETNHLVQFLINLFGVEVASELISRYFIGTSKHWNGATVFWQIDIQGIVRTGKIMLYSPSTGKRVKEPFDHISWAHKALKQPEFELRQCFFGEHLLKAFPQKPVAIAESEKTALIASIYLPQFIWLAAGSKGGLNSEKCSILKGRTVLLFPDLNCFEKWSNAAMQFSHHANITVSDLLERKANEMERKQGLDLADYLTRFDFREFVLHESEDIKPVSVVQQLDEVKEFEQVKPINYHIIPKQPEPESWEQDIADIENYFTGISLPLKPVRLNPYTTIKDVNAFVQSHLSIVKANNGKPVFMPYLNRLQECKKVLSTN